MSTDEYSDVDFSSFIDWSQCEPTAAPTENAAVADETNWDDLFGSSPPPSPPSHSASLASEARLEDSDGAATALSTTSTSKNSDVVQEDQSPSPTTASSYSSTPSVSSITTPSDLTVTRVSIASTDHSDDQSTDANDDEPKEKPPPPTFATSPSPPPIHVPPPPTTVQPIDSSASKRTKKRAASEDSQEAGPAKKKSQNPKDKTEKPVVIKWAQSYSQETWPKPDAGNPQRPMVNKFRLQAHTSPNPSPVSDQTVAQPTTAAQEKWFQPLLTPDNAVQTRFGANNATASHVDEGIRWVRAAGSGVTQFLPEQSTDEEMPSRRTANRTRGRAPGRAPAQPPDVGPSTSRQEPSRMALPSPTVPFAFQQAIHQQAQFPTIPFMFPQGAANFPNWYPVFGPSTVGQQITRPSAPHPVARSGSWLVHENIPSLEGPRIRPRIPVTTPFTHEWAARGPPLVPRQSPNVIPSLPTNNVPRPAQQGFTLPGYDFMRHNENFPPPHNQYDNRAGFPTWDSTPARVAGNAASGGADAAQVRGQHPNNAYSYPYAPYPYTYPDQNGTQQPEPEPKH